MLPAVRALERHQRVLTFSLGEIEGPGLFDAWAARIDCLLDAGGHAQAPIVGVSFGGLVAAWYAARRPGRVSKLILVSAPSPRWRVDDQSARYARHPRLSLPFFAMRAVRRLSPELLVAVPGWRARVRLATECALRAVRYPASPRHMAGVVEEWRGSDLLSEVRLIRAPTLVITGEDRLDRVVPVSSTLEYLTLIPGARHVRFTGTGHLGFLSKPSEFAKLVTDFAHEGRSAGPRRRP
jgi:pimeloyl-ACP methyl ester carboxylesterase